MKRIAPLAFTSFFVLGLVPEVSADKAGHHPDPLPPGLDQAIRDPKVAMIVDATILKYNKFTSWNNMLQDMGHILRCIVENIKGWVDNLL